MKALLSIKPEYANKIFDGSKKFEFRRTIFKHKEEVRTIVVYASSPVCRVVGEFEVGPIISSDLIKLWAETSEASGITKDFFFSYFGEKEIGHAITVKKFKKYKKPLSLQKDFNISTPPQSFQYLIA